MSLESALQKISAQQPEERTPVWTVGEQLKDILRAEPSLAELVAQDLDVKEMSLAECEKKIEAFANAHKTRKGNFASACVIPSEAEGIIREFYGLSSKPTDEGKEPEAAGDGFIRLEDFF